MEPWNIDETRQQIARLFGRHQLNLARDSLRSIDDRMTYAAIHYQDAVLLINTYVDENLKNASLIEVMHRDDESLSADFNLFIRKVGAHLIACIQSIHTLPDILAHAIYTRLPSI